MKYFSIMITYNIQDFILTIPQIGKILAIDFGTKKLGIAVSNHERTMSLPLSVISANMNALTDMIKSQNPSAIVIGMPVNMDGSASSSTDMVNKFADQLFALTGLTILLQDERLTSRAATQLLKDAGMKRRVRDAVDDCIAACMILDTVLSRYANIYKEKQNISEQI